MPANSSLGAIARQWELLKLMPSARSSGYKVAEFEYELSERGFAVSKRTIQRDLIALSEVFDIDVREDEEGNYWRWQPYAKLDLQSLELTDALTLRLIEQALRPLLPASVLRALEPRFKNAAEKLDSISDANQMGAWPNKVASVLPMASFIPPEIDPNVLEEVQNCLLKDFAIECKYRSVGSKEARAMVLHPLGLVQRGHVSYLVATANEHDKPRTFALHRMSEVENAHVRVKRPLGFTLKQFIDDGGMGFGTAEPIKLVARISPMLARELSETKLSNAQKIREDNDWFIIEAAVKQTWQLEWWLLSKIGDLVVIEPEPLRKDIAKKLEEAYKSYSK